MSALRLLNKSSFIIRYLYLRQLVVCFRAAVAEELPSLANLLDNIKVKVGNEQLILVAACLRDDLTARVAKIALAVKLANLPRLLPTHSIDRSHKIAIRRGMGGLFQLPEILGKPRHGG